MTRGEEIKKQADIYTDDASNYTEWSDDGGWSCESDIELVEKAFAEGAKWADANPKSPWIRVKDDLPCNHEELISLDDKRYTLYVVALIHGIIILSRMYKFEGKWSWENDEPTHWMPIPKLPK